MPEMTNLTIKIERDLKVAADLLFRDMGMSLTTAVNVFVRQAVMENAMPFRIYRKPYAQPSNAKPEDRKKAMREIREMMAGMDAAGMTWRRNGQSAGEKSFERDD